MTVTINEILSVGNLSLPKEFHRTVTLTLCDCPAFTAQTSPHCFLWRISIFNAYLSATFYFLNIIAFQGDEAFSLTRELLLLFFGGRGVILADLKLTDPPASTYSLFMYLFAYLFIYLFSYFYFFGFSGQIFFVALAVLELCRPSCPQTQGSTCLCLLTAGIKGMRHYCSPTHSRRSA